MNTIEKKIADAFINDRQLPPHGSSGFTMAASCARAPHAPAHAALALPRPAAGTAPQAIALRVGAAALRTLAAAVARRGRAVVALRG